MPFDQTIASFAQALTDPARAPPVGTKGREHAPDARRFGVYRNNVAASLIAAVKARYPVTRRLVGEDFFRAMTRAYVAGRKPRSAVLLAYGDDFPEFVVGFEPARDIVYLADVARLESAWVDAYHAAEAVSVELAALAAIDSASAADLRLTFHPAARLLLSNYPAASIWAAHQSDGEVKPPEHWRGEDTLITRPNADVLVRILPAGGSIFAHALRDGATLGEAHSAVDIEGFDPGTHLVGLIEAGAISELLI